MDIKPIFSRKVKFMDTMIMKGEKPLAWAMRICRPGHTQTSRDQIYEILSRTQG